MVKPLALFLIAAVAGYLTGRPARDATPSPATANSREAATEQKRAHWETEDFAEWIARPARNPEDRMPVTAPPDLSEWSDKELRAALDSAMGPDMSTLSQKEWYQLTGLLFEEWAKRDFDALQAWFELLPSAEIKSHANGILAKVWPVERGEEALDFAIRNNLQVTIRGGISYPLFLDKAVSAAARRGPVAVAEAVAKAAAHGMESRYSGDMTFPDGFDFAALASRPEVADIVAKSNVFFAGEWAARDLEGAFTTLVEKPGRYDTAILSSLLSEASTRHEHGDSAMLIEQYTWLAGRASAMDPETAGKFVDSLTENQRLAQSSATELGSFVGNLEDPELRKRGAHQAAIMVAQWNMGVSHVLKFLESSGPPEERIETLRHVLVDNPSRRSGGLMPRDEALLRQRLTDWGIATDQADQLANDIKSAKRR